jgi:hypothetical protein
MTWLTTLRLASLLCRVTLSGNSSATFGYWSNRSASTPSRTNRNYPVPRRYFQPNELSSHHFIVGVKLIIVRCSIQDVAQADSISLSPDMDDEEPSETEYTVEAFSPISPNADPAQMKPLGYCDVEFSLTASQEANLVMWELKEYANAGKLLRTPPMPVVFYDEYEMRKVYSLIYDVFRCEYC